MLRPLSFYYRVKKGDSLSAIAQSQYGDSRVWPVICKANRLPRPDLLFVGMGLNLPTIDDARVTSGGMTAPVASASPRLPAPTNVAPAIGTFARNPAAATARTLQFPALAYELGDMAPLVVSSPEMQIKLSFSGQVSLQKKGSYREHDFASGTVYAVNNEGKISATTKSEYDTTLSKLAGQIKLLPDLKNRTMKVSCGFTVSGKVAGEVFTTSECEFTPPNRYKFTYKPRPVKADYRGFVVEGEVGFEVEVETRGPRGQTSQASLPAVPNRDMVWFIAGGLVVAGVTVIVIDALKDAVTLGAGAIESPVSWAFAAGLFARAGTLVQ